MSIHVRKARPEDAPAVWGIANSRFKSELKRQGASDRQLAREGFLFYLLEPDQYRERIERSDHFWVATNQNAVMGFFMAYTLVELQSCVNMTENDRTVL